MSGASGQTRRVTVVNANWTAGQDGGDGAFELLVVTEDGVRHSVGLSPAAMTAVVALTQAGTVLLWDPEAGTLIAANVVGSWIDEDWSAQDGTAPDRTAPQVHPLAPG